MSPSVDSPELGLSEVLTDQPANAREDTEELALADPVSEDGRVGEQVDDEDLTATPAEAECEPAQNPGTEQDAQWVRQTLAGELLAFDCLVGKYQRQAVAVSYRLLGNADDAREVVQDALLKAFRSLDTLDRPAAFGGWLMRIVTNLSLNFRRGRRLRLAQSLDGTLADMLGSPGADDKPARGHGPENLSRPDDPVRLAEGKELGDKLQAALMKLPEKQRQALILFTVQEMPQKDVADTLNCSVEAVKWHVFQGRKRLKQLLKDVL